ncbi:MAG: hypothetical protein KAZ88_12270 [Acidimicrobiia bacterium]|nr:hypothetical protein [Acidimicrobiia bacterium]
MADILRIGRLAINQASAGVTGSRDGSTLSLSGDLCGAPEVALVPEMANETRNRAVAMLAHSIAGLSDGAEPIIAVCGDPSGNWDPSLDGIYRVTASSADMGTGSLVDGGTWSVGLDRIDHRPLMESVVSVTRVPNAANALGQAVISLPAVAGGTRVANSGWVASLPEPSTPTFTAPYGSNSSLLAWSQALTIPASGVVRETWECPPDAWLLGSPRIAIPVQTSPLEVVPLVGRRWPGWLDFRQMDGGSNPPEWWVDNGLVRFAFRQRSGFVTILMWCYQSGAWIGPYEFVPWRGTLMADRWNRIAGVRVRRNDAFEVAVDVDLVANTGLVGTDHLFERRDTMTLRLQRGRHHARFECRSEAAHVWQIQSAAVDPTTAINAATMVDTTATFAPFRWLMGLDVAQTTTLTSGIKRTTAAVRRCTFSLGAVIPNALFDVRPTQAQVAAQIWSDVREFHRPIEAWQ